MHTQFICVTEFTQNRFPNENLVYLLNVMDCSLSLSIVHYNILHITLLPTKDSRATAASVTHTTSTVNHLMYVSISASIGIPFYVLINYFIASYQRPYGYREQPTVTRGHGDSSSVQTARAGRGGRHGGVKKRFIN
jgi:hypothetical protein